jgi:hypothetical protein
MPALRALAVLALAALLPLACDQKPRAKGPENQPAAATTPASISASAERCPHEIKPAKCPFCNPSLIESDGFCGEHGVAEALCYKCRPYLKTAFKAKGDWCAEHNAPDSQCLTCHPELKDKIQPGVHGG